MYYDEGYGRAVAVTPNDSSDLSGVTQAIYVGGAGDLHVTMSDGSEVTFVGIDTGETLPLRVRRVYATDTTATDIVALYHQ